MGWPGSQEVRVPRGHDTLSCDSQDAAGHSAGATAVLGASGPRWGTCVHLRPCAQSRADPSQTETDAVAVFAVHTVRKDTGHSVHRSEGV